MSATVTGPVVSGSGIRDAVLAARAKDRRATFLIALQQVLFGVLPVVLIVTLVNDALRHPDTSVAVDFRNAYYVASYRLLHGGNPYSWTSGQLKEGAAFVYPAFSALIFTPFTLISRTAADVVVTLVWILLTPLTLWVLRVRDWRIYGITLAWLPVFVGWQSGNETILLILMSALVWRYREKPIVAGALTAAAISMKPFMWPLALWLLATRRWRASGYGLIAGIAINLVSWSLVGWHNVGLYLRDSGIDTRDAGRAGYSIAAAAFHLGLSNSAGDVISILASAALVLAVAYVGFVKRDERRALTLAVALMLVASPIVWSHYFALLLIPMAIERPRLNVLWFLPLLMWVCPPSVRAAGWQEATAFLVAGIMFAALARTGRPARAPARRGSSRHDRHGVASGAGVRRPSLAGAVSTAALGGARRAAIWL